MTKRVYIDASALVKLARREAESVALRDELRGDGARLVTSMVGRIEFERAIRKSAGDGADTLIEGVLDGVDLIPLNVALARIASTARPPELRALDAIHLTTIMAASDSISHVYCYDKRLADAARDRGIEVRAPS